MKKIIILIYGLFRIWCLQAQNIIGAEYFFDNDPGVGNGTAISIGSPSSTVNFTASISTASIGSGFHVLAVRTKDANNMWSLFETRMVYVSFPVVDAPAIIAAEYFIDADPGVGAGTSLSVGASGNTINFTSLIPTTSLANGFHILAIRTKNANGFWSLFETRPFYILSSPIDAGIITNAEYFIDTDPGTGNGTAVSVGTSGGIVNFTASVPTASLSNGFHTLALRTRNADGVWSLFETRPFYISASTTDMGAMSSAEYFIDTDPGAGNGSALTINTPGNTVNQTFLANVPAGTTDGQHLLVIRTRDVNGNWSLFETAQFTVSSSSLPLKWLSFTAKLVNEKITLDWITENEVNTSHFIIERSGNGIDFSPIGNVGATGSIHNEYTFDDVHPLQGLNFYRLKQVDQNGKFEYSSIVKVFKGNKENSLLLYPNPVATKLSIEFKGRESSVIIQIYDASGKMVQNSKMVNQTILTIPVSSLASGTYWIVVSDGVHREQTQFIKQ